MSEKVTALLENDFATDFAKDTLTSISNMVVDMELKGFKFTNLDKIFTIGSGLALVIGSKIIGRSPDPKSIPRVMGLIIGAMIGGQVVKGLPAFNKSPVDFNASAIKLIISLFIGPGLQPILRIIGKIFSVLLKPFISMPSAKNMMKTKTTSEYNGKLAVSFYIHIILGFGAGALSMWLYAKKKGVTYLKYKSAGSAKTQINEIVDEMIESSETGGKIKKGTKSGKLSPIKNFKNIMHSIIGKNPKDEIKGFSSTKLKNFTSDSQNNVQDSSMNGMINVLIRNAWNLADKASKGELSKLCSREVYMINKTGERVDVIGVSPDGTIIVAVNPNNSALFDMNERELAAVFLHELGHYSSKQFRYVFATALPLTLLQFVPGVLSGVESIFLKGAISYYSGSLGKFHEIQADKYAIERGFGKELASALKILIGKYIEKHNYDNYEVHGNSKLRIEAILAESANYDRFE